MKQVLLLCMMIIITGCKKNYSCKCTTNEGRRGFVFVWEVNYQYNKVTKKQAQKKCEEDLIADGHSLTDYTCSIK